jgi:hypothetical protein
MVIYNNTTLSYRNSSFENCLIHQTFGTYEEFFECYKYFVSINITRSIIEILLSIGTSLANALVIICLILKPKKTIFDQIIFGHSMFF